MTLRIPNAKAAASFKYGKYEMRAASLSVVRTKDETLRVVDVKVLVGVVHLRLAKGEGIVGLVLFDIRFLSAQGRFGSRLFINLILHGCHKQTLIF